MAKKDKKWSMKDHAKKKNQERVIGTDFGSYYTQSVKTFSPDISNGAARCRLDVVPYKVTVDDHPEEVPKGMTWFRRIFRVHKNQGPESQTVVCPTTVGLPCPICALRAKKLREGLSREEVSHLKWSEREIYNVIDKDNKFEGVQILNQSSFTFGNLLKEEMDEDEENNGFGELKGGKTLLLRFKKKKYKGKPYPEISKVDFRDRPDYPESILKKTYDLDKLLKILSEEELEELLYGVEGVDGFEDEEETKSKKSKKSKKDDDEFDESDEDEDDEDEEDDDDIDEEDEEDESEEEEHEEEEKSKKRKKPGKKASGKRRK